MKYVSSYSNDRNRKIEIKYYNRHAEMKIRLISSILSILIICSGLNAQQTVDIDNDDIQAYKGKTGKWIQIDSKQTLNSVSKKYNSNIDEIYLLNNINNKFFIKNFYFIPYSEDYLKDLEIKNITRLRIISSEDEFIWPVIDAIETSSVLGFRNGRFHPGLDLPALPGKPVVAAMEGLVVFSGYADGYGRIVVLEHKNNYSTKYGHNYVCFVKKGDFVKKGQIIALVGSTGISTGNHLHFEIRCMDIPMDPLDFLPQKNDLHIIHTLKNWK
jgi:murein DD-endopeptidase MepM/ murein hydrolase activator NlpD